MLGSIVKSILKAFAYGAIKGKTEKELNRHASTKPVAAQVEAGVTEATGVVIDVAVDAAEAAITKAVAKAQGWK